MEEYILSLDYGTQSVRGMVFDPQGRQIWKKKAAMPPYDKPAPDRAEIDPVYYKKLTVWLCHALQKENPDVFEHIGGLCIACMRDCLTIVDKEGEALRPLILWLDQRRTSVVRPDNKLLLLGASLLGAGTLLREASQVGYTNYLMDYEKDLWEKADKFVFLSGYLHRWLLGFFLDCTANQPGHVPFDSARQQWSDWRDIKYYVFPVEKEKLVPLVPPGTIMGTLSAKAAEEMGLSTRVKVIAGASDKACETLGVGCVDDTEAVLSFGSQATVQTMSRRYYELQTFVPSFPAAIPQYWNPELQVYRGYWMVQWFLKEMETEQVQKERKPEDTFDLYLRKTPPGNEGLVLYPYWGASAKYPLSSGTLMGFRDYHGKEHLYRAIIEGINYTLRWAVERMEQKKKSRIERVKVTGGGAESETICQMTADMFGRDAIRMETTDTTSLGAAMLGYVALGRYGSFQEAAGCMTRPGKVYHPQKETQAVYDQIYPEYIKDLERRIHFNVKRG